LARESGRVPIETLEQSVRRVLLLQVVFAVLLVLVTVLITAIVSGPEVIKTLGLVRAKSVAFGSLLGILATVVTARSVIKSSSAVAENPYFGMLPVYSGLLFKLVIVAGGTFAGLVYLGLGPLMVVLGYITMQAGYMWVAAKPAN